MVKKIILGFLLVTVIGAGGTALAYNIATHDEPALAASPEVLANKQAYEVEQAEQSADPNKQVEAAQYPEAEPWQEPGTIAEIDDYGFQFALPDGEEVYVELGPPDFWRNQGVELQVGQLASVSGTVNEGVIHAAQIMLVDGQTLQVRTDNGQPLWSGGVANAQGQNVGQSDVDHVPDPQAQVDEWVTLEGTVMAFQGGNMTMATSSGEIIAFQTGQPRFFAEQGITFSVGDEVIVVGFYEGDQFMAGDITQIATGLRVMLRDPNGRPLWAGPGNSNGNGNGGNQGRNSGNQGGSRGIQGSNGFAGGNH